MKSYLEYEMSADNCAPIAVFAYNRPDCLVRMMDSLQRCEEFDQSIVTIFVDGPKNENDKAGVDGVRRVVQNLDLPNVGHAFSEINNGLRRSIYAGVSDVCARYGRVIVLEDDLILHPNALRYFNAALIRYENAESIWAIVAYIYNSPTLRNYGRALVLPFAHPWGWATWKRAWDKFSIDIEIDESDLRSAAFATMFDMNGLYPFSKLLKLAKSGTVDSWFIMWLYTIFQNGGRSIFPPHRLVENYGLSEGTHATSLNPYDWLVHRPTFSFTDFSFPEKLDVDFWALDDLKGCYELRVQRLIAWAGYMKRSVLKQK